MYLFSNHFTINYHCPIFPLKKKKNTIVQIATQTWKKSKAKVSLRQYSPHPPQKKKKKTFALNINEGKILDDAFKQDERKYKKASQYKRTCRREICAHASK
jgi:hypothetical protein